MTASVWTPDGSIITANAENASPIQKFIASAGQTVFTLTEFSYVVDTGSIRVYRNGQKLQQSEVSETSSNSFTLVGITLALGEVIEASAVLGSQDAVTAAALSAAASAAEAAATVANTVKKTSDTGAYQPPVGDTSQRPLSPQYGDSRVNSELGTQEWWNGTAWIPMGGGQMLGKAIVKGIAYNAQLIDEDITIPTGVNAYSAGPMQIASGRTVTFEPNSYWKII